MLIFYDANGTIVTQDTQIADIVGNINCLDVTIPTNKVLNRVDVKVTPNVAVLVDVPKTDVEQLQERINMLQIFMVNKDLAHDTAIADLTYKLEKLDSFVKSNLKGGEVNGI